MSKDEILAELSSQMAKRRSAVIAQMRADDEIELLKIRLNMGLEKRGSDPPPKVLPDGEEEETFCSRDFRTPEQVHEFAELSWTLDHFRRKLKQGSIVWNGKNPGHKIGNIWMVSTQWALEMKYR